jgi:hypothetical protein
MKKGENRYFLFFGRYKENTILNYKKIKGLDTRAPRLGPVGRARPAISVPHILGSRLCLLFPSPSLALVLSFAVFRSDDPPLPNELFPF